ncbi:MAG: hypothetical protein ACFFDN_33940 [Candidatus Hodarchaeota archaeon]
MSSLSIYSLIFFKKSKVGKISVRKPRFYWKEWDNVKRDLKEIIKNLNERFPTRGNLEELGRLDLLNAIQRYHGGLDKVKEKMGYKIRKKSFNYWKKWDNVEQELEKIIKIKNGEFPVKKDLINLGRVGLLRGIQRYHDGYHKVREKMGYEPTRKYIGYWEEWGNIKRDLEEIIKNLDERFPTKSDLEELGRSDLLRGIERYHGGLPNVREKMGYMLDVSSKRRSYYKRRGKMTQEAIIEEIKIYADLVGFPYSEKKEIMVGPHHALELVCDKNIRIGVDTTNAKTKSTVEKKWTFKKYHMYVDIFWVIVLSNKWGKEQYEKWNCKSPDNVFVVDGRRLEEFLNSIGSNKMVFKIPDKKKLKLDALAECTYYNKEKVKKEYDALRKIKKLDHFIKDKKKKKKKKKAN